MCYKGNHEIPVVLSNDALVCVFYKSVFKSIMMSRGYKKHVPSLISTKKNWQVNFTESFKFLHQHFQAVNVTAIGCNDSAI